MDIPSLLDLSITKVATMIKGKEPDEVKRLFNIDPDLTPEEEKLVRDQNQWIFEVATAPSQ
jgi:S-phase kinase-associated protein 1